MTRHTTLLNIPPESYDIYMCIEATIIAGIGAILCCLNVQIYHYINYLRLLVVIESAAERNCEFLQHRNNLDYREIPGSDQLFHAFEL